MGARDTARERGERRRGRQGGPLRACRAYHRQNGRLWSGSVETAPEFRLGAL